MLPRSADLNLIRSAKICRPAADLWQCVTSFFSNSEVWISKCQNRIFKILLPSSKAVYFGWGFRTHSVCVCTIHQNVSLLTDVIHLDYHDLVKMVVCNSENRECMIHRCENGPGLQPLKDHLFNMFEDKDEETVTFKKWTKTDRSELITCTESVLNLVELLCEQINSVTTH